MDVLFLFAARGTGRFYFLSVGNGHRAVPILRGTKMGNGTEAVPYIV